MKKVLSFLALLIILLFPGCEKDKETDLSEYLIGGWITPTMYSNYYSLPCHYEMIIKNNMQFSIERVECGAFWMNWPYSVDQENRTITIISVDGNQNEITYRITLTDDPETMIWMTDEPGGETFLWQRGDVDIIEF
jgi:hypothetical protein